MEYIQGTSREQITMLPECLDDYVSEESPVRVIDAFIDSLDLKLLGFDRAEPHETAHVHCPGSEQNFPTISVWIFESYSIIAPLGGGNPT